MDDSYSRDQSFSRGGSSSLNTSTVRRGNTNQDFAGQLNAIRQNVRQQATSGLQGFGMQGASIGRSQSPTSNPFTNFLSSANNTSSSQQNPFAVKRNSLTSPTNIKMTTAINESGTFKKRIADSVAGRLSPVAQQPERSGLSIHRGLGGSQDIWGLKMTNPTTLTLAGRSSSPPRFFSFYLIY